MLKIKTLVAAAAMIGSMALATVAQAGITQYSDLASLGAAGTITQSFNFDGFPTNSFSFPGNPYSVGDVTFQSRSNIIVPVGSYSTPRNTIGYDNWTPLPGAIAGTHDLFGFNLTFSGTGEVDIILGTNLGSYTFANVTAPTGAFAFQGFKAGAGEYFQSFTVSALNGAGNLVMGTDFNLGTSATAGAVPEPATWALMIGGFGMVGFAMRRRSTALTA